MCAKKNIKQEILDTARELFNKESWSKISIRKIANKLSISDGNLRYHFKTKEEIVLDLFIEMTQEMMMVITNSQRNDEGFGLKFKEIFVIMYKYRFLFLESYFIKKEYESYTILFNQLEESRKHLFLEEFDKLKIKGVLSQNFTEEQYEMLFEQIFILSDSWIKYIVTEDDNVVEQKINHYSELCNALIVPYKI